MVFARYTLIALALMTSGARADAPTGLVVVGDANLKDGLQAALDAWLTHHGRTVSTNALDRDGILTITNCVNVQDLACARGVVEKRAKTAGVVFAQVASTKEQTVTVQVFWIVKGHEALAERRACEECSADALKGTVDTIMGVLAPQAGGGARVKIVSKPPGATVVLDHEVIGVAPVERDVAVGAHEVVLMKGTHEVGRRAIKVHADESAEISIAIKEPVDVPVIAPHHSRVPGALVLGVGIAGIAAGAILYATSQTDDGSRYKYTDTRPAGIAIGVGGVAATAIGILLLRNASVADSAPVVAIDPHGGYVGWARAF